MMSERTSRKISLLQFVCALMIISLHTTFPRYFPESAAWTAHLNRYLRQIDDAAISTFFFLSAYLFFRRTEGRTYAGVLLGKVRSLVIPYVLWNAVFYAHALLRERLVNGRLLSQPTVMGVLKKLTLEPANSIFWFFLTLMGFVVIWPLILWGVKRRWPAIAAAVLSAAAVCIPQLGISYYSMLFWLPVYLMGAYIGYWHRERFERTPAAKTPWRYASAAILLLAWAALRPLGHQLHYLYWIPAPLCLWLLADGLLVVQKRYWWMESSFYLYCSHMVVEHYAVRLYQRTMGPGTFSYVLGNLLLPCLCAAIALIGAAIVRKLLPNVYEVFTGMRKQKAS